MPNYCYNNLIITGDIDVLVEKLNTLKEKNKCLFNGLIGRDKNYNKDNWYEHNTHRYGTKWDIKMDEVNYEIDGDINLSYSTAWSPSIQFISTLCKMYNVTATLSYCEGGNDFAGIAEFDTDGEYGQQEFNCKTYYYLYDNEYFFEELEYWSEDCEYEDFIDEINTTISDEDIEKIKLAFNVNKYNL